MGEGQEKILQFPCTVPAQDDSYAKHKDQWVFMEGGDDDEDDTHNTSSLDNSSTTNGSTSSSDMADEASSLTSYSSSNSNGPLYELSELIAHLPIKRGLSKYYQGKSKSFTSLSRVTTSIEDLAKKETPYRRKMKASKSYANGLDFQKSYTLPRPIIAKKVSKGSMSLCFQGRRGSFLTSTRPPPIPPPHKKF